MIQVRFFTETYLEENLVQLSERERISLLEVYPVCFNGFAFCGHANSADYGHDIICAASTSLAASCIASLTDIAELAELEYTLEAGEISCHLGDIAQLSYQQLFITQVLLRNLLIGIQQVQASEQAQLHQTIELTIVDTSKKEVKT